MATLTYTFRDIKGTLEDQHIICRNCGNKHYVKYKQDILKGWGKPSVA
jgi:ribosomal protein L37E